ncbi:MAG: DUF3043 domain-containing protein [Ancrocorticia sp.]
MFGKKKETEAEVTPEEVGPFLPKGQSPRKGSPTPKRKQAEAANRRPIVADHRTLTKEEKRIRKAEERARSDEAWRKQQDAMKSGDERNMPAAHAGPVRRFARDYLDARTGIGVGFMPMALVLLASIFVQAYNPEIFIYVTLGVYAIFILMIIDSAWAVRNARTLAEHKFGADRVPPRFFWQMFTRTFYLRRWRLPAPQVKRGQYPAGGTKEDLKEARRARKENKVG